MRLSLELIRDPDRNGVFATAAVATTVFLYAYSLIYGPLAILAVYGLWLPIALVKPDIIRMTRLEILIWSFPLVLVASVFWSTEPSWSLRAALQFATTLAVAHVAARVASVESLLKGLVFGCLVVAFISWLDGGGLTKNPYALYGLFGSKNQLGLVSSIGILAGLSLVGPMKVRGIWLPIVIATCLFQARVLQLTDSVTSFLSLLTGVLAVLGVSWIRRIDPGMRRIVMPWTVTGTMMAIALALWLIPLADIYGLVGKDVTMTGRTFLWSTALQALEEHPLFGFGFQAFWRIGNIEAERLWALFDIKTKMGFHFHNAFIQVAVDVGVIGVVVFAFMILTMVWAQFTRLFDPRISRKMTVFIAFTLFFLVRVTSEVDFYYQYTVGTFLIYVIWFKVARFGLGAQARAAAAPHARFPGRALPPVSPVRPRMGRPRVGWPQNGP